MESIDGYSLGEPVGRVGPLTASAAHTDAGAVALALHGDGAAAEAAVSAVASAHQAIESACVPRTLATRRGCVVLDADAVGTGDRVLPRVAKASVPYAEGIVVTRTVADALAAAHAKGRTLGSIGLSNVLVLRSGAIGIIGFGAHGAAWADATFAHPMVAAGGTPTPSTDVYAALMFVRSLVPYVSGLPAQLAQILGGGAVGDRFSRVMFHALTLSGNLDGMRARATLVAFWRTMGVTPDEAGFARRLAAVSRRAAARLTVGPGAAWFVVDAGPKADLSAKRSLRSILLALTDAHSQGRRVTVGELVAAGWPGELLKGTSGPDRLYTALASLRAAGLRDVFERTHAGYCIHPEVEVVTF